MTMYCCAIISEHVTHLHSSIEASDCRVDEASDNGVQDKGQNLQRKHEKHKIYFPLSIRSDHRVGLSSLRNSFHP